MASPWSSWFFSVAQALDQPLRRPVAQGPDSKRRVDPVARGEDGPAEDVEARRVMHAQLGVNHRSGRIFSHTAAAEIVAAHDAPEARTAPGLRRAHLAQYLLRFALHPVGEPVLIFLYVVGDAHEGHSEPAPVTVARIEVEKVGSVRERVRLQTDGGPVLPGADVVLPTPPPG